MFLSKLQVLQVHEELEKSTIEEGDNLDASEKAIVREMCNVSSHLCIVSSSAIRYVLFVAVKSAAIYNTWTSTSSVLLTSYSVLSHTYQVFIALRMNIMLCKVPNCFYTACCHYFLVYLYMLAELPTTPL